MNPFAPEKREPVRYNWVRAIDRLSDDPAVHQYLLAYASEYGPVVTSLHPHGQSFWRPEMQVASLDHAMWFHRSFRMDEWLLYAMQSSNACKARGLAFGKVFDRWLDACYEGKEHSPRSSAWWDFLAESTCWRYSH